MPRHGQNIWDYKQRVCLHLLYTHERNISKSERTHVFNYIFNDHLTACCVPGSRLESKTLYCQYAERTYTNKNTWKATWENVCHPPNTDEDRQLRARLRAQIAEALNRSEEVDETVHVAVPPDTPPATPRRTQRVVKTTQNPYEFYEPHELITPVRQRQVRGQLYATSNAYATPGPSSRKRPAAAVSRLMFEDDDDELLHGEAEYVPRAKRARLLSPTVFVPPPPADVITRAPRTPKKSPKRREGANMLFVQPSGRQLMLKPKEHEQASRPLQDVTERAAHPNPPGLLFRYWHDKSHGINSSEGFVSGKFVPSNILVEPRGPPDCASIDMNDFAHHLNNRTGTDQDGIPSPFISTANNLAWGTRMALKRKDLGAKLSVIDPSKLEAKSIYYVPPFYEALKQKRCFERGYFGYRGTHEHMIYHRIPTSAMVKTFTVKELIAFSKSDRDVKRVLRLDVMAVAKTPSADIIKALKHDNITVNSRVAGAVGKVVIFLGLDHNSSREMLSRAVFEVVQGWALKADGVSQEKADCFIKQFQDKSNEYISIRDQLKLEQAFLHGLQWSCGDINVHLKGRANLERMENRAVKRGLINPSTLLINKLNEIEREITSFEAEQRELLTGQGERRAVSQGRYHAQQIDNDDEGEDAVPRQLGLLNLEEYIHYE